MSEPCPWCKSTIVVGIGDGKRSWMRCSPCEADGPKTAAFLDWHAAEAAWNRRAPDDSPSEQELAAAEREQARNGETWAILFHDTEMPPDVFHGEGAEEAARRYYHIRRAAYNCVLLAPASVRRAPDYAAGAEAMREAATLCEDLRRDDWSGETEDWAIATTDCATTIRALLLPEPPK